MRQHTRSRAAAILITADPEDFGRDREMSSGVSLIRKARPATFAWNGLTAGLAGAGIRVGGTPTCEPVHPAAARISPTVIVSFHTAILASLVICAAVSMRRPDCITTVQD